MLRSIFTAALLWVVAVSGHAQSCSYRISGVVTDAHLHTVPGAVIRVMPDSSKGAVTDSLGNFFIDEICPGHTLLTCQAAGYAMATAHIDVSGNNEVRFTLNADPAQLHEVVVNGIRQQDLHTLKQMELQGLALMQTRGEALGNMLKQLPGMNAIQTGPTLSKPVIHGLHSNRVLIINNGVRQEGQQWGNEHAPEIDPFIASRITVVKGAAGVRYGPDAIAGVVLLDAPPLPAAKGISGDVYALAGTNGRMGGTSAMVQGAFDKGLKGLAWRLQGTMKRAGNFRTPHYFLKNSGMAEGNFSAAAGYKWHGLDIALYYSSYNTRNGIFEGSHVGNIADLMAAFQRSRPATASYFSYDIERSYQQVRHDLAKASAAYHFANEARLDVIAARQYDVREEYDISLPYTTNVDLLKKPQVSFQLITHSLDAVYTTANRRGFSGSIGGTSFTQGNVFKGIRYLIPNFRNYNVGAFAIERYSYKQLTVEAGLRYDYRWLRVYRLNTNTLQAYNSTTDYKNWSATVGAVYRPNDKFSLNFNTGSAWRAPSVNELYIHGIHFSDASYQDGDSTLQSERSLNTSLTASYHARKLRATVDVYYNAIGNYIYSMPQLRPVTLVSGTYPSFVFTQADAHIHGVDATVQYDFAENFTLLSKATIVRGYNRTQQAPLIFMPADRLQNGITYSLHNIGRIHEPYISVENVSVLTQIRVPPNSDYVAPPKGYSLLNANVGCSIPLQKHQLTIDLSVSNLTNVVYRDYLDRFRYYADELGVNFTIRTKYSF